MSPQSSAAAKTRLIIGFGSISKMASKAYESKPGADAARFCHPTPIRKQFGRQLPNIGSASAGHKPNLKPTWANSSRRKLKNLVADTNAWRRRIEGTENTDVYRMKHDILGELEILSETRRIDLYYADEASVSLAPNVPCA